MVVKKVKKPNALLRTERKNRGWSQARLAEMIGADTSMVSRWECGERKPEPHYQEKLCNLFSLNALQLGFLDEKDMTVSPSASTLRYSTTTLPHGENVDYPNLALLTILFNSEQKNGNTSSSQVHNSLSILQMLECIGLDMNQARRMVLLEALGVVEASVVSHSLVNIEPWERLRRALKKPSRIDESTVDHLEVLTNDCWRMIPVEAGVVSRYAYGYVLEQLETATTLLEGSQRTAIHNRLCAIASELSLIAANISSNMRYYRTAKMHYELSIEAAQEAKNASLQAVGLVRLSFNSTRNDQPNLALPLVQEADSLVAQDDQFTTATTRSWVAAAQAEVHANLGNSVSCFRALEQAELPTYSEVPIEDPYHTTFTSSLLAGYKGVCYTLLHLPNDAERVLNEALKQLGSTPTYQKGYILSDIANACIQQGKVEEMYKHASNALDVAIQTKSPDVFQRVRKVRAHAEKWKDTFSVKELDKQIRSLEFQL